MGINLRQFCDNILSMNWSRLKSMKCPQCQGDLKDANPEGYACSKHCGFYISAKKFNLLVGDQYQKQNIRSFLPQDNSEALNNLGHIGISEDFSDSPFLNV
jgi:hypothetical protein